ncbi:hypothetical protein Egran_03456, partial [Elaphomyces granulatus]
KRRFVRQNREIARANSVQSLRIQTLESEVSRLLRENASLRQQVISLRNDVEKYEAAKLLEDGVYDFREKLDIKLAEIGGLVAELGRLPRKVGRVCQSTTGTERQNSGRHRRIALDTAEEDGRLPVILEDKYFPRKTLEPQELEDLANGASEYLESPKIGTPPIAHFDVEGSPSPRSPTGRFEFTKGLNLKDATMGLLNPENGLNEADDFVAEVATSAISQPAIEPTRRAAKSGSKRKFSSRDEDDRFLSDRNVIDNDFEFSRPLQTTLDAQKKGLALGGGLASKSARITKCKVLEPKSTNMQPVSPRKRAVADKENRKTHKGLAISDEKANNRTPVHSIRGDENDNIDLDHCTDPADNKGVDSCTVEEIGSTTATESRQQIQWKKPTHSRQQDTPEPGLYTSGLVSRPTRRPRGAVSYAEPNLRDKMRRPTNEFVDAVGADRFRRVSNSQGERKNTSEDYKVGAKSRTMLSKEGNFNEVPSTTPLLFADLGDTNPTGPFPSLSDLPATVNTVRKRRTLSANKDELVQSQDFDINIRKANRRRRRESGQAYIDMHSKTSNDEESLLRPEFENDAQVEKSSVPLTTATSSAAWMSRRYLSNPENEREKLPHLEGSVQAQFQQVDDNKQLTREDSNDSVSPTEQSHFDVQDDRQRSPETNQRRSKAIPEAASTPAVEGEIKRAQRAAARRRSMLF